MIVLRGSRFLCCFVGFVYKVLNAGGLLFAKLSRRRRHARARARVEPHP